MNSLMLKLEEFRNIVDKIYGVYLDSTTGFQTIVGQAISSEKLAQENIIEFQKSHSEYAHYNLPTSDEMTHWYGRIVKKRHKNRAMHLHQCSFSELKDRNHPQGDNFRFIANMCLT